MLTPPFKQHLSREFGAEERYHIYQRLIPIHQPSATDPHGLPEKSAKTQNASERKGIWREKTCFRARMFNKFLNDICVPETMNLKSNDRGCTAPCHQKKNAFHRWLPNQVPNEDCDRTKEQLQEQNAQEKVPHLHISDMQWRHKDTRCE